VAMRYWLSCPQCGWEAKEAVDEHVKRRMMTEVVFCQECRVAKRPPCRFVAREVLTVYPKGKR